MDPPAYTKGREREEREREEREAAELGENDEEGVEDVDGEFRLPPPWLSCTHPGR
jgi:hypothetical protein